MQAVKNHFKGNGLAANAQEFCQQTLQLVAVKLESWMLNLADEAS